MYTGTDNGHFHSYLHKLMVQFLLYSCVLLMLQERDGKIKIK